MPNRGMGSAVSALGTLATCALLSGCAGDAGETQTLIPERLAADADATVVIHMTGLLLVVPPAQDGGRTQVLLPTIAEHAGWLGFGVAGDEPYVSRLCLADAHGLRAIQAGICYVDLDEWSLQPFGEGGPPTPATHTLPSGVLDATEASGGEHRVQFASLGSDLRARVVFDAGQVGGHCSLASWSVDAVNAQGVPQRRDSLPLINVLDWEIRSPTARTLVFVSRSDVETITVPLPAPGPDGRIELLLAHTPLEDLQDLPPALPDAPAAPADTAYHFAAFYDLLRDPATGAEPPPSHRPLPHTPTRLSPRACEVRITTPPRQVVLERLPFTSNLGLVGGFRWFRPAAGHDAKEQRASTAVAGIKTYGCVVGSAQGS